MAAFKVAFAPDPPTTVKVYSPTWKMGLKTSEPPGAALNTCSKPCPFSLTETSFEPVFFTVTSMGIKA